ncbi:hypothetical protein AGLY_012530 [Aphis glycines]|uniref:Uncharacterized protein n=1 Tax=Aphis glycines TaxID=307491 RepID=A0A6G0TAT1_APHGL|nr:hypothetical protein AGLY_012530 [Aphis glycines]
MIASLSVTPIAQNQNNVNWNSKNIRTLRGSRLRVACTTSRRQSVPIRIRNWKIRCIILTTGSRLQIHNVNLIIIVYYTPIELNEKSLNVGRMMIGIQYTMGNIGVCYSNIQYQSLYIHITHVVPASLEAPCTSLHRRAHYNVANTYFLKYSHMGHFFKASTTRNPNYKHICQFFETIKARKRMRADASATAALLPRFSHHL